MCDLDNRNNQHRAPARTDNRQSGSGFLILFFRNTKAATRRQELSSRVASNTSSRGHRISRRYSNKKNMRFKSLTNDQTVPRYRYFNFYKPHKVDGKGFSSQMPTLKTVPSDQKSNRRTCAEECQMPFKFSFQNSFLKAFPRFV